MTFKGQFRDLILNGPGSLKRENYTYKGGFTMGEIHGLGGRHDSSTRTKDGYVSTQYYGEYQAGSEHGCGVILYSNGNKYEGEFSAGRCDGLTKVTEKDHVMFGRMNNHRRHGPTRTIMDDGTVADAMYDNGAVDLGSVGRVDAREVVAAVIKSEHIDSIG